MKITTMKFALLIALMCFGFGIFAQTVVRGPYLQMPTEHSIIVRWRTNIPTDSKVSFGQSPMNLIDEVTHSTLKTEHIMVLENLSPYTDYYYSIGSSQGMLSMPGNNYRFRTNPIPGDKVPIRVWAIGDFGKGNAQQVQVKQSYFDYADTTHTDVWIWLGDNAYADGKDFEYDEKVFDVPGFSDAFSFQPFWPSPGNHDYNEVWSQSTLFGIPYSNIPLSQHQGPYYELISVPQQAEVGGYPSNFELFYSFDYGNVHFLSLNSELYDFTETYNGINEMKAWIEEDLAQNTQTFTIAYFHQPPYSKGSHDSDAVHERVMKAMREKVIPLLESYDIDLVVCGHSHVFERSHLIHGHYGGSGDFDAATMLMDGNGGDFLSGNAYVKDHDNSTGDGTVYVVCGNSGSKTTSSDLNHPVMYFSDGGDTQCGSFVMDIYRNRLDGRYLHMNGDVLDEFTIVKKDMQTTMHNVLICPGESAVISPWISGGSDNVIVEWLTLGSVSDTISVDATDSGVHLVEITDLVSGQVSTHSFEVILSNNLILFYDNDTIWALGAVNCNWYLDGILQIGYNQNYFLPQSTGNYVASSSDNTCFSEALFYDASLNVLDGFITRFFRVYPNPTAGEIIIQLHPDGIGAKFQLFNSEGKIIQTGSMEEPKGVIDLQGLSNGVYTLRLQVGSRVYAKKVLLHK